MITTKEIDYMQYNIDLSEDEIGQMYIPSNPIAYYRMGYIGQYGERVYTGNIKSDKALVVWGGKAINNLCNETSLVDYVLDRLSHGANFTRFDMAMTCYVGDDLIDQRDYVQFYYDGKIETKNKWNMPPQFIGRFTENDVNLETLYFGEWAGRGKNGIVRVYDKGLDLGWYANAIVRLEIEDKRKYAQASAKRFAEGKDIGSVIKTRFNVKDDRWQRAIDAPEIETYRGTASEKPERDTWKWLIETVAPTLGREIALESLTGKTDNFELFNKMVSASYEKHIRGITEDMEIDKRIRFVENKLT